MQGRITHIQRLSTHDGPGIRSTVFLQGCNLRCPWCHNPETWEARDILQTIDGKTSIVGKTVDSEDVVQEVLTDKEFFANSGGGVTLSGGEPVVQVAFSLEILRRCKEEGLSTGVETNLLAPWEKIEMMLPWVDLWMCDLKCLDSARHKGATGVGNEVILDNLKRLSVHVPALTVRTPVIPCFNDTEKDIRDICAFLDTLDCPVRYELLGFHTLGFDKFTRMGLVNPMKDCTPLDKQKLQSLQAIVRQWETLTKK